MHPVCTVATISSRKRTSRSMHFCMLRKALCWGLWVIPMPRLRPHQVYRKCNEHPDTVNAALRLLGPGTVTR